MRDNTRAHLAAITFIAIIIIFEINTIRRINGEKEKKWNDRDKAAEHTNAGTYWKCAFLAVANAAAAAAADDKW